jgi:hypothetical protein
VPAWVASLFANRKVMASPSSATTAGRSPSLTLPTASSRLSCRSSSNAPVFSSAEITGPSPTTPRSIFCAPASRNSRPNTTRNISGKTNVKNNVALSR